MAQQTLIALIGRQQEMLQQRAQPVSPGSYRSGVSQRRAGAVERLQQGYQRTDQRRIQPTHFVVGFDAGAGIARPDRIAQQHAPQAETPGIGFQPRRQALGGAALGIHAPTNASPFNPAA